jgi:hypothetical protein
MLQILLQDTQFKKAFDSVPFTSKRMFEKVTGTHELLSGLQSGSLVTKVIQKGKHDSELFRIRRKKYLLYQ